MPLSLCVHDNSSHVRTSFAFASCTFAILLFLQSHLAAASPLPPDLDEIFFRSHLNQASDVQKLTPQTPYDPALISVLASVHSREPRRTGAWAKVRLKNPSPKSLCPGPFEMHVRRSGRKGFPAFIIFPGSFATFRHGSFTNQTVAALDKAFGDPSIFAFSGFLSPDFLKSCRDLPRDEFALAADLYAAWSKSFARDCVSGCGVIGFSGGGNIALGMLSADAIKYGGRGLITRGALAISPILDKPTAFQNLDSLGRINAKRLSSLDFLNILNLARNFWESLGQRLEVAFRQNPEVFHQRFYNEFIQDLADARRAVGLNPGPGYLVTFGREFMDLFGGLLGIEHPALVISGQDDPVLSTGLGQTQPECISRILNRAEPLDRVWIYNPRYGAHTGILLDDVFDPLVAKFFGSAR